MPDRYKKSPMYVAADFLHFILKANCILCLFFFFHFFMFVVEIGGFGEILTACVNFSWVHYRSNIWCVSIAMYAPNNFSKFNCLAQNSSLTASIYVIPCWRFCLTVIYNLLDGFRRMCSRCPIQQPIPWPSSRPDWRVWFSGSHRRLLYGRLRGQPL